jgi:hypothetical protein
MGSVPARDGQFTGGTGARFDCYGAETNLIEIWMRLAAGALVMTSGNHPARVYFQCFCPEFSNGLSYRIEAKTSASNHRNALAVGPPSCAKQAIQDREQWVGRLILARSH